MPGIKPQFLVDERGKKKAVLLSIKGYQELIRRVEDLEDALELDEAVRTSTVFEDYGKIREELRHEGHL